MTERASSDEFRVTVGHARYVGRWSWRPWLWIKRNVFRVGRFPSE